MTPAPVPEESAGDRLALRGLRAVGRHGVLAAERSSGQVFVVDAVLMLDTRAAAASDDLTDTVDYGLLAHRLVELVEGEPVNLIETLADRLATACLTDHRVVGVEVSVHKPAAPLSVPFDDIVVSITRARQ